MQHIHSNLEILGYTTSINECIVSPVVTVPTLEISKQNMMSHQGDQFISIRKDADDDQIIDIQPWSHRKPRKSEDQPVKPEPLSPEDTKLSGDQITKPEALSPEDSQDFGNDQPMKHKVFIN